MNIFAVHENPRTAAQSLHDRHVVKMITETAQLLSTALPENVAPYKHTHFNHPCAVWTRQGPEEFHWLAEHGLVLGEEYMYRFCKRTPHKSVEAIQACIDAYGKKALPWTPSPFPQCMPEAYRGNDCYASYRAMYANEKAPGQYWTRRKPPEWVSFFKTDQAYKWMGEYT